MATHSNIPAWRTPWTEEPDRLQSMGLQELDMTQRLNYHHHLLRYLLGQGRRERVFQAGRNSKDKNSEWEGAQNIQEANYSMKEGVSDDNWEG